MTLPIDRTAKSTLDSNLVNGVTSNAPAIKASDDVVYNTIDELFNFTADLINAQTLSKMNVYNLSDYGTGDGTTDDYAAINTLITDIGSTETTFLVNKIFRIGTDITFPSNITLWFLQGGQLKPDSGITATINGAVLTKMYQIFSGLGSIVLTKKVGHAYPEWFGALGNNNDDTTAIQKCHDSCVTNRVLVYFTQNYGISSKLIWSNLVPSDASMVSVFNSLSSNPYGLDLSDGNFYGFSYFPAFAGFSGYAFKIKGTNAANIHIPSITNCGDALILETMAGQYEDLLDTNVYIQQIGACTRGIVFSADNSANVMQGNEIKCNFISTTNHCVEFENNGLSSTPQWDSNNVVLQATDPTTSNATAIVLYNPNIYAINRFTFRVESWSGGLASGAKWVSGKFNGLTLFINPANAPMDNQISVTGADNKLNFNQMDSALNTPIEMSTTSASKASFNSGVPLFKRKVHLKATLSSDLTNGSTRAFYVYHQCTDANTNNFFVTGGNTSASGGGCIIDRVFDNSVTNDDEILIIIRNVSGSTITSGTVVYFTLWMMV